MIAVNIFDRKSDFLTNFHCELSEANSEAMEYPKSASSKRTSPYVPSRLENRIMERSRSELQYDRMRADECDFFTIQIDLTFIKNIRTT